MLRVYINAIAAHLLSLGINTPDETLALGDEHNGERLYIIWFLVGETMKLGLGHPLYGYLVYKIKLDIQELIPNIDFSLYDYDNPAAWVPLYIQEAGT